MTGGLKKGLGVSQPPILTCWGSGHTVSIGVGKEVRIQEKQGTDTSCLIYCSGQGRLSSLLGLRIAVLSTPHLPSEAHQASISF